MIDPVCFKAVSVPCHMYEEGASTLTCVSRVAEQRWSTVGCERQRRTAISEL
jgi:hypothetical protein